MRSAHSGGFTLVEVLVSLSIFAIVVTMSVGSLLVLIAANSRTQSAQMLVNSVATTLDSMVRDIRTGYDYQCGGSLDFGTTITPHDCLSGASSFAFTETGGSLTNADGDPNGSHRIGFRFNTTDKSVERRIEDESWVRMTPDSVEVSTLDFVTTNTDRTDDYSPVVTVYLAGTVYDSDGSPATFNLETTITQQMLDI